jgi:hypothetical protein
MRQRRARPATGRCQRRQPAPTSLHSPEASNGETADRGAAGHTHRAAADSRRAAAAARIPAAAAGNPETDIRAAAVAIRVVDSRGVAADTREADIRAVAAGTTAADSRVVVAVPRPAAPAHIPGTAVRRRNQDLVAPSPGIARLSPALPLPPRLAAHWVRNHQSRACWGLSLRHCMRSTGSPEDNGRWEASGSGPARVDPATPLDSRRSGKAPKEGTWLT